MINEEFDESRRKLASLLTVELQAPPWTQADLADMWEQLLTASIQGELRRSGMGTASQFLSGEEASPPIRAFRDLIGHRAPPALSLDVVRRFAKGQAAAEDSAVALLGRALYFSVVATAAAAEKRLSKLADSELLIGLSWVVKQQWIDDKTRVFLEQVRSTLRPA